MAFRNAPVADTYSSQRVRLTREINSRAGTIGKDEDFVNVFIEPVRDKSAQDNRHFIVKRAGCTQVIASQSANPVRGMHYWEDNQKLYYAVLRNVYVYNVATGVTTTLTNVFGAGSGTGDVGFTEFLYDNNTVKIIVTDGTTLSTIDNSEVVVANVDADLPLHQPYPVFLDGYIFVAQVNSADIYNSDLNNPLSWTPGNFLSAEMEPDLLLRITKINNYLIAFGKESVEYFWDAGNTSGSPLQRNETPIKINTYLSGFAQLGNAVYYIGKDHNSQPDVFVLKDFKIDNIGSPSVSRYLNLQTDGYSTWKGNLISFQGHSFYVVTAGAYTYVVDTETKLWARWQFKATTSFPIVFSTAVTGNTTYNPYFALTGSDSTVYKFSESLYQDNGTNFDCIVVTEQSDFGTLNQKLMSRLVVVGDRPPNAANVTVQWTDDDYQSFNTGLTTDMNQDLPSIYRLGSFRQRAFKLTFTNNTLFRIQELEVDINKGAS